MIRSTVRTEISLLPRRLQMRKPPASGWRFCSWYTSIITGSQALRDGVFGAELWSSSEAKLSRSKRPIHSVMVGRETCKNRLILVDGNQLCEMGHGRSEEHTSELQSPCN